MTKEIPRDVKALRDGHAMTALATLNFMDADFNGPQLNIVASYPMTTS